MPQTQGFWAFKLGFHKTKLNGYEEEWLKRPMNAILFSIVDLILHMTNSFFTLDR